MAASGFGSRAASVTPAKVPTVAGGFGSRGGSAVKIAAAAGGGFGSRVSAAPPPAKMGGGGILGTLGEIGHVIAKTGTGLANDAYNLPGGLYTAGKAIEKAVPGVVEHPLRNSGLFQTIINKNPNPTYSPDEAPLKALADQAVSQTESSVEHPLRHPDQTLLNVLAGAGAIARVGAGVSAATDAAKAGGSLGDTAKALIAKPVSAPRLITVGEKQVALHPSASPLVRNIIQAPLDKVMQGAIDKNPEGNLSLKPGSGPLGLASYATKRVGGALAETRRFQEGMTAAPAQRLATEGKALGGKVAGTVRGKAEQAALRLTSENRTPEGQIAMHTDELAKVRTGDSAADPKDLLGQIKLMKQVIAKGLVKQDADGNTVINAEDHPALARVDALLAKGSAERDQILSDTGQMSDEGLTTRRNAPAQVQAGARFSDKPIPDAAKEAAALEEQGQTSLAPRTPDEAVGKGFLGGGEANPGRGYVPYYATEAKNASGAVTRSPASVVGEPKPIVPASKTFTGEALTSGKIPDNTTGLVARQMQRAYKYASTDKFRKDIATAGSDAKRTDRDVLVRTGDLPKSKITDEMRALLGDKNLTLDELAGHQSAFDDFRQRIMPGLADKFATEKATTTGTAAPAGYKWVDRNLLGDLGKPGAAPMGKIARGIDTVNSAQTAATVYFKLGHVATRGLTNAATNIIQGSIGDLPRSYGLWKELSPADRDRAVAAAGQAGIQALPHEGENIVGRVARSGAHFWARRFDQPFRFNSIAYEARKAGFDTPAKFRTLLDQLQNPDGLSVAERAKVEGVAKRANREGISYDRLNETERRYISRGIWFYPWVKGATAFAGHALSDHPYKSALLGTAGAQGATRAQQDLGAVPSYERGAFKIGGSEASPFIMNLNTISPFATPAEVAESVIHANHPTQAEQFSNYLSPAVAAAARAAFHLDSFGSASTAGDFHNVFGGFASSTPEEALIAALTAPPKSQQGNRLFPTSKKYGIEKFLLGSGTPRTMNRSVANRDSVKELRAAGRK